MSIDDGTNDSKASAKTDIVEQGFENRAFSNDDNEVENIIKNNGRKHSIFLQEKQMFAYVCKTPPADCNDEESPTATSGKSIEKDESLQENGNRSGFTETTEEGEGQKAEKEKKDREKQRVSDVGAVETLKESDDISAVETCADSEEENSEEEPPDMYFALARSSIDLRDKGLKAYKFSKTRKTFIIFSCFFMQVCLGLLFSLGILYVELLEAFGSNRSVTSLVQSLPLGLAYILGLIVGPIIQKLGLRLSIFCGGLLTATGFIASSFVNNIFGIIILVGCISGTGISLFNIGSFASLPVYFGKKQRIAVAFTSVGTGVGAMVWPLINRILLEHFGWRGNLLVMGGILLNVSALSLFFKPLPIPKDQRESKGGNKKTLSMRQKFVRLMNMPRFIALMFWCVVDGFASPVIGQMIVDFSRVNGYGKAQGAMLLVYFSACNALGRAIVGIISRFNIPSFLLFALSSLLCGVAYSGVGYSSDYWMTFTAVIIGGFMLGAHVAFTMMALLKTVGSDLYGLGWGLAATCLGTGFTISGPVAGYISDQKSYNMSYYVAGFSMIADVILYSINILICKCLEKKKKEVTLTT